MQDFELKKRQILDRVDLQDVVAEHVTLKRSGRRLVGLCPFHAEKTPSFTVSPEQGLFKCFGCGKGGDLFSFVQQRENVTFIEAMGILADRAGVELGTVRSESAGAPQGPSRTDLARVNSWALGFFRSKLLNKAQGRGAREYLHGRGFLEATGEQFSIGLAIDGGPPLRETAARAGFAEGVLVAADLVRKSDDGRLYDTFRNRLMFPIRDVTKRVIGFGGRTMVDDKAKYLNTRQTPLFDKGRNLYGLDLARDAIVARRRAVLVEGYTDCLACHQADVSEAVATLGTALTDSQVDLLRRYCDEIILLFDSDDAGEAAADRAIHVALPRCVKVRLARIPEGKDPCDFLLIGDADAFSDLLNRAIDALEFKWSQTQRRFRADESDAKRREAVLDFLRVVGEASRTRAVDAIQRGLLVNQVAHLLRMDRDDVNRLLARSQTVRAPRAKEASSPATVERPAPRDSAQAAWTHLLEVLLNEPALLSLAGGVVDPGAIADEQDRRIAEVVIEAARRPEEFRLGDILARCHNAGDAERVAELARRGAERANYEATFRVALHRLDRAARRDAVEGSRARLLGRDSVRALGEDPSEDEEAVSIGVRAHGHYVPRRLIRGVIDSEREPSGEDVIASESTAESP